MSDVIKFLYLETPGVFQGIRLLLEMEAHPGCLIERVIEQTLNPRCTYPLEQSRSVLTLYTGQWRKRELLLCDNFTQFLDNGDKGFILVVPDGNGFVVAWQALQMRER